MSLFSGGVILYSAIFQHTPPIQRTATFIAGHGIYHHINLFLVLKFKK